MFFEDEENDGVGRTRKFVWKNVDGVLNWTEGLEGSDNENTQRGHSSEEENEEEWRKMRHERELLLAKLKEEKENSLQLSIDDTQKITKSDGTSETSSITKKSLTIVNKRVNVSNSIQNDLNKSDTPFLVAHDTIFKKSNASFLTRDAETLNRIAQMVKEKDEDVIEGALGKARNFVFSVLTPPQAKEGEKVTNKRPSDTGQEVAGENKRQKLESNNKFKKRLLDSLE